MTTDSRPREELLAENMELRLRLEEAAETLAAIGNGEVDAFVVSGPEGEQVFTLKGAEHPYRVLVETMNEGAATLTTDGTILYCNNRLAAMLRFPLERLIGTQLSSYVTPADRPLFEARLAKCSCECDKDEIAMITAAGNSVPVMISCCAADFSGNNEIGMVVTDLTQHKRNEEILASERLARSIIEQAGEAIIVCDEGGRIIRASRLAHQLCGENPLLKPFDDLFRLRIVDTECMFSVLTPLHGGNYESIEVEFERSDDRTFHLLLNSTPLKSEEKRIIGCVVTLTDFTERRQTEEELRQSEESLQAANSQLNEINQALHEQSGLLQAANEELHDLNDKLQSQSEDLLSQAEELQTQHEELQSQGEELQAQNRELARLWEESRLAENALKKLNDELEDRVADRTADLAANIRKLKIETAERIRAVEALREKEHLLIQQGRQAAMGEMIGNIAHQWRQPLNTLGLTVQHLSLCYEMGDFSKEFLEKSVMQSMELIKHMSRTIDDFRNFFRPDKEKAKFKVSETIANTLTLIEDSFKTQHIAIEVVVEDDPVIHGYANEFAQALLNILNNARDVLKERGCSDPRVRIAIGSEGDRVVVTVADNAGGIPGEIVDKIFDPYFTTKGPQSGTGVGLFMSRTIIETNMGGRLSARNTEDGAEFRIEV